MDKLVVDASVGQRLKESPKSLETTCLLRQLPTSSKSSRVVRCLQKHLLWVGWAHFSQFSSSKFMPSGSIRRLVIMPFGRSAPGACPEFSKSMGRAASKLPVNEEKSELDPELPKTILGYQWKPKSLTSSPNKVENIMEEV
eukprot:GHVP01025378.1.p1 GENE.GHVP01025378.1~~GHVP01025378.1.p1  ORF type:complete len:141 (-),score=8.15 GHVP01025378.1:426-848(-)